LGWLTSLFARLTAVEALVGICRLLARLTRWRGARNDTGKDQ
jgi:hypothetical protein